MRWTLTYREASGKPADGEIVWSRPPDAEVKPFAPIAQGDGGYQARHTGYSIHTCLSLRVVPYLMRRKASRPIRITFGPGFP